jgi:hypothetical protein
MQVVLEYIEHLISKSRGNVACLRFNNFVRWCIRRGYNFAAHSSEFYRMVRYIDGQIERVVADRHCYRIEDLAEAVAKMKREISVER